MDPLTRMVAYAGFELRRLFRLPAVMFFLLGPIVFYPTMIWAELQVITLFMGQKNSEHYEVGAEDSEVIAAIESGKRSVPTQGGLQALRDGGIDAFVTREGAAVVVHTMARRPKSANAAEYMQKRLKTHNWEAVEVAFVDAGGREGDFAPYKQRDAKRSKVNTIFSDLLGFMIAFLGLSSVVISALHPANAVFVSDREEQTAETLQVSAVPRGVLVGGKLLAVTAMQVLAGIANLSILYFAAIQGFSALEIDMPIPVPSVAGALVGIAALCTFCFLVCLVCATCLIPMRTYKEAQNVGGYGVMMVFGPMLLCGMSLLTTTPDWMWAVPMGHTLLIIDALLSRSLLAWQAALVFGVDLLLAAAWLGVLWITPGPTGLLVGAWRPPWLGRLLGDP